MFRTSECASIQTTGNAAAAGAASAIGCWMMGVCGRPDFITVKERRSARKLTDERACERPILLYYNKNNMVFTRREGG